VITCGVCGSENEAAALFCGTCGSPLPPAEAKSIAEEVTKPEIGDAKPDDTVVPGQGGARRDVGTGAAQDPTAPPVQPGGVPRDPGTVEDEVASGGPTIVCSVCGTVNDANRTYCRKCANELKPPPPPPPTPPPPQSSRRISPVAIGLGAAAVVVAIALIGILVLGGGKPGATLGPTAGASQPVTTAAATAKPTILPTARTFSEGARSGLVAFARCSSGSCAIYVINADGKSKSVRLTGTNPSAFDPSLSHDRTRVVYSVAGGLRIVNVKTKSWVQQSASPGDSGASWAPHDAQLTWAGFRAGDNSGPDLEIRVNGDNSKPTQALTLNDLPDTQPVFTPDGASIVFVEGQGDQAELMKLDVASKAASNLTKDAFQDVDPAVSPDGTEVVFASNRGGSGGFDLFVLDLATLAITALPTMQGDERHPAFSPGGRYIVFSGGTAGAEDLFILDRSDGKISALATGPSSDQSPTWQ
jgi:Tol biopolymer transport system component